MKPLPPPDCFHLSAAVGWLELGNPREARAELEAIALERRGHPDVLEVRWQVEARSGQWERCRELAGVLVAQAPERPSTWVLQAYALRRAAGGGLRPAWDALRPAAERFPQEAIIPYNLACYACQMGQPGEAWSWLKRALKLGDARQIKAMALEDPDLEPLRSKLRTERGSSSDSAL
ncbi:MAG: tetratricopeptide repeat protein [Verrucomicrobia bacterium]|nr:tetratricopeptide repeat protein [Verrucomicrobiota bacterium]